MHTIISHWQRAFALWRLIWLATRAGKISPCCPLEIARFDPGKECIYEIFGQYRRLSLRKHERLSWVYGATDEVGFPGSGNKNDILDS